MSFLVTCVGSCLVRRELANCLDAVAKGAVILPKSVTPSRIESNLTGALEAYSALTPEDIKVLDGVASGGKQKRFITPPWGACFLHKSEI